LVASLLTSRDGKLVEDFEPITIVVINALTTDLEFNGVDQEVTKGIDPAERRTRDRDRGDVYLEVNTRDQVAVTRDRAADTLAEVSSAVEGLLDRLHGKVRVTAVHDFKESNLRITCEVHILQCVSI